MGREAMRGAALVFVLGLGLAGSGCGPALGVSCGDLAPCDDGAVCDFTSPDGPICISADGDIDGDGLDNAHDFCQHQEGGAFDEDHDGIGDDCDPCPISAPPSSPDPDGDAVDRPCDLFPNQSGDRIVFFDGFNTGELPVGGKATAGWTFDAEAGIAIATPTGDGDEVLSIPLPSLSPQTTVFSRWNYDSIDPLATENQVGVLGSDIRPAGESVIACLGSRIMTGDRVLLIGDAGSNQAPMTNAFNLARVYQAALKLDRTIAGCALVSDDKQTGITSTSISGEAMSRAGLIAKGTVVRFRFLLVIQPGPGGT